MSRERGREGGPRKTPRKDKKDYKIRKGKEGRKGKATHHTQGERKKEWIGDDDKTTTRL